MTAKELLEQYTALNIEIIQIERELGELVSKPTHLATDCVLGSPNHEPYQNRPIPISGYVQSPEVTRERKRLVKQYDRQLQNLYFWQSKAEEIFSRISDAKARVILRYRYIDGLEWQDIAAKIGGNATEDSIRKYATRILEKF